MRIRTVKPAFWGNEKLGTLPDFTRLLAIGLLNYADDYGYFWANPKMVRGALFPFEEDSSRVRKGLAELEAKGYIRLGTTADGREVGHVVKFSTHQKVDKPGVNEIQPLASFDDHSSNDPRKVDDRSALDRIGREGKGKDNKGESPTAPVELETLFAAKPAKDDPTPIPGNLVSDEFAAAWADWKTHRSQKKKPLKPGSLAEREQLKALSEMGEHRAIAAVRNSIANDYTGIFEPSGSRKPSPDAAFEKLLANPLARV